MNGVVSVGASLIVDSNMSIKLSVNSEVVQPGVFHHLTNGTIDCWSQLGNRSSLLKSLLVTVDSRTDSVDHLKKAEEHLLTFSQYLTETSG